MVSIRGFVDASRRLNQDEEGANVLETVLLVAIAAIIGLLVKVMGTTWQGEAQGLGDKVMKP